MSDSVEPGVELQSFLTDPRWVDDLSPDRIPSLLGDLERLRAQLWARVMNLLLNGTVRADNAPPAVLLDVPTVARRLQVPVSYVYELGRRGELPTIRVGKYVRVHPQDLETWVARHHDGLSDRMRRAARKGGER